jgi:predicted phosphodiesterase
LPVTAALQVAIWNTCSRDVSTGGPKVDTQKAILARLAGIGDARVVLCGHTHMARIVTAGGILIVNPGSVGMPA